VFDEYEVYKDSCMSKRLCCTRKNLKSYISNHNVVSRYKKKDGDSEYDVGKGADIFL